MLLFWPIPGETCLCVLKVHLSLVLNLIYTHSSKSISELRDSSPLSSILYQNSILTELPFIVLALS